jgi:hypothetical protein
MSFVALDLATMTGKALWLPGTDAPRLSSRRLPGRPEELGPPLEALRSDLADIHALDAITHLFFEASILPGKTNIHTVNKLCALAGMAEWFAHRVGAICRRVEQQSWRKHFIGRGNGKSEELKAAAIRACQQRGWAPANDHEADAAGVLDFGLACFDIKPPWRDAHLFGGAMRSAA